MVFVAWVDTPLIVLGAGLGLGWGLLADRLAARWPAHEDGTQRAIDWRTPVVAIAGAAAGALLVARFGGLSVSGAWVGILVVMAIYTLALVVLFATNVFTWLPAVSLVDPNQPIYQQLDILILPTLTLVVAVTPYVSRIMRASMIEVLESDYVEMARLKGLPEREVVVRHALPNAIVPTIQVIALQLAYLAGGVVVVEAVFGYAGVGAALVDAVKNHDLPVVQTLTMLIAGIYVLLNLAADIATILITPRLRTSLR